MWTKRNTRLLNTGNAAIVLRSRLKVKVLKDNREKKGQVDEKGIILTNGDMESSWKAVQYQVKRVTWAELQTCLYSEKKYWGVRQHRD